MTSPKVLYKDLLGGQVLCKGHHEVRGREVKDEPERDGDGQGRESLLEDGQHDEGETQALGGGGG